MGANTNKIKEIEKSLDLISKSENNTFMNDSLKAIVKKQKAELEEELATLKKEDGGTVKTETSKSNDKKKRNVPMTAWTTFVKDNLKAYSVKFGSSKEAMKQLSIQYHKDKGTTKKEVVKKDEINSKMQTKLSEPISVKEVALRDIQKEIGKDKMFKHNYIADEIVQPKETVYRTKIGTHHKLFKSNDNHYTIYDTDTQIADLDIEKHNDGKWHMTCLTMEKKSFDKLSEAINYAERVLYRESYRNNINNNKKVLSKVRK